MIKKTSLKEVFSNFFDEKEFVSIEDAKKWTELQIKRDFNNVKN